jgi:cysteine desulfurase
LIGADPSEVVFTSGGTEGDNFAIRGTAEALERTGRRHLIASAIEHEAVLNTLKALAKRGWDTTLLPVDDRNVSPDDLRAALRDDTAPSRSACNNDWHDPVDCRAARSRTSAARCSTATRSSPQARFRSMKAPGSTCFISAHKFYGPKGVGDRIRRGLRSAHHDGRQARAKPARRDGERRRHRRHGRGGRSARAKNGGRHARLAPPRSA